MCLLLLEHRVTTPSIITHLLSRVLAIRARPLNIIYSLLIQVARLMIESFTLGNWIRSWRLLLTSAKYVSTLSESYFTGWDIVLEHPVRLTLQLFHLLFGFNTSSHRSLWRAVLIFLLLWQLYLVLSLCIIFTHLRCLLISVGRLYIFGRALLNWFSGPVSALLDVALLSASCV